MFFFFTFYFIDVDTFYLFSLFSSRVSDDRKYVCDRRPRFQRNYIIVRDQKSDLHGTSFRSSPKINRMFITTSFAYNESLQQPTIVVSLIKILIFFFYYLVVFTCSKVINAFKR